MKIISHRGYWKAASEKNTSLAFDRSFSMDFGTETDVRDLAGRIVISHDAPLGSEMDFNSLLKLHASYGKGNPLALNVKADGLQAMLKEAIDQYPDLEYFFFDMAVPDALLYKKYGLRFYSRLSEYEPESLLQNESDGIWLDSFFTEWYTRDILLNLLQKKPVCIVSPDLHKRPHHFFWNKLFEWGVHENMNLMICTDYPEDAREFFCGKN